MRVRQFQRIEAVLNDGGKSPAQPKLSRSILVAALLSPSLAGPAWAQSSAATTPPPDPARASVTNKVSASDQMARDDDRERILREELRKSEAAAESLAKRKVERLAAGDTQGADEAEEQRVRAIGDIAGLRRELAAMHSLAATPSAATAVPTARGATPAALPKPAHPAPWWDVYGKARRVDPTAPVSFTQPPAEARALSTPRME